MTSQPTRPVPASEPDPGWKSRFLYHFMHLSGMTIFNLGFSYRKEGSHHVPRNGPVLVIANHQSFLDPWLVGLAIPRQLVYLARKTLFRNPLFAWLIRSLNAVPIDQEGVGKEGIRAVLEQLDHGHPVLVFPEGERCADGRMHPLKPGIHLLLKKAPVPVLPVGVAGAFDAYPRHAKFPIPAPLFLPPGKGTLAVSVGPPLSGERFAQMPRGEALEELFQAIAQAQARAERLRRRN